MTRLTTKKIEDWQNKILKCQSICNRIYEEIYYCGISDDDMDVISNLTCTFDEAYAEIEELNNTLLGVT